MSASLMVIAAGAVLLLVIGAVVAGVIVAVSGSRRER